MKALFVDCPNGIAGDMLLSAFLDLGVPKEAIEEPLLSIGLGKSFSLSLDEGDSFGIRGLRVNFEGLELDRSSTRLKEIIKIVENTSWDDSLRDQVLDVFKNLAVAESSVHGKAIEEIHFHEVGSLDALIEVVGICAAVQYLNPAKIFCSIPPAGSGTVKTSHGLLPVPVPVVMELAKMHKIKLAGGNDYPKGELTTPTGLAVMALLADNFCQPTSLAIEAVGIGLGQRILDRPNLLRLCLLNDNDLPDFDNRNKGLYWEPVVLQEAWIDDATPEDISYFTNQLREAGAIDVVSYPIQMKKDRQGVCIRVLAKSDHAESLRLVWFLQGTTIGLRERFDGRWILFRRSGICPTPYGDITAKQVRKPDGSLTIKPEHDDLVRISIETGESIETVRQKVLSLAKEFVPDEDWSC